MLPSLPWRHPHCIVPVVFATGLESLGLVVWSTSVLPLVVYHFFLGCGRCRTVKTTFVQGHKRSINAGKSKHTKQQQNTQTRRWPGNLRVVGGCVFGLFFVFFHYEPRRFMVNFLICAYSNVRTESQRYRPQQETWSWRKVGMSRSNDASFIVWALYQRIWWWRLLRLLRQVA